MEKFGIFELLDTLSALSSAQSEEKKEEENTPASENVAPVGAEETPPQQADTPLAEERPDAKKSALQSLLARHDGISKRIDKNK